MSRTRVTLFAAGASSLLAAGLVSAAELRPATLAAFDRYVRVTEARMAREVRGEDPFLWFDRLGNERKNVEARLRRGEIVVNRLETREGGDEIGIPDGMRHHWVGTVFLPGVRLAQVLELMQDYGAYADVYHPNIQQSRTLSRDGDRFRVFLRLFMKKVISVELNTENDVIYARPTETRLHVRSYASRIAEVENGGTADEHEKPVGNDSGFLWRFNNYCSAEERMAGTYVQCESVSLTRDVPFGLGWLIGPFVTGIPRESLEFTLNAMRQALAGAPAVASR